jgi:hypothetical protein
MDFGDYYIDKTFFVKLNDPLEKPTPSSDKKSLFGPWQIELR